jgi:hypothetical protein
MIPWTLDLAAMEGEWLLPRFCQLSRQSGLDWPGVDAADRLLRG